MDEMIHVVVNVPAGHDTSLIVYEQTLYLEEVVLISNLFKRYGTWATITITHLRG